ncbi:MAG: glucose 1-dehydrogenase [Bacteroidetes bacterium]|nr:glucose 1-dehydrogenase [Bacteroidota bacterium]
MKTLSNKIALVTGAGSGIGKAIATLFAEHGASVVLADLHQVNIEAVAKAIKVNGGTAICYAADVSREDDVKQILDFTLQNYGTLDILVNNAGIMDNFTPVEDVTDELWQRVMGVNVNAAFYACRSTIRIFLQKNAGVIINIASVGGLFGGRAGCAYTTSKHAIVGLTKNIGYDYAQKGIRCNAIAPGGINTNITHGMEPNPFGFERMNAGAGNVPPAANPDAIAELALFLASEKAYFINGAVITADGGWTAY